MRMERIETEVCIDHVHILIEIPPKYSVSSIIGYLKGFDHIRKMGGSQIQVQSGGGVITWIQLVKIRRRFLSI